MLRVGLSGGIASGKSTVSARLAELGAVVVDADQVAREVVEPGMPALAEIVERFGAEVLTEDGALDRSALGAVVFGDEAARRDLEAITHPRIRARTVELLAAAPADAVVVHDIPLLVEMGLVGDYALTIMVQVDAAERVRRLVASRGMSEPDAWARLAAQVDDETRQLAGDVVLDNSGTPEELRAAVDRLWADRLVPFEENLRTGRGSRRPEQLSVVDPDPAWPNQAERLLGRVRAALGAAVARADHTGSTSIPGLSAKDVIDLQVVVEDLSALAGDAVEGRLRDRGFLVAEGDWWDHGHDGQGVPKAMMRTGDPARVVHCHVRRADSPAWRLALLFRDWMRADADARADYAALKFRLQATGMSTTDYTEAKEPWFAEAFPRAEAWARRTRWSPGPGEPVTGGSRAGPGRG